VLAAAAVAGICLAAAARAVAQTPAPAAAAVPAIPSSAQAEKALERAGVIRGRPGGALESRAAITKDELAQFMASLVRRIDTVQPQAPTPAPSATKPPSTFAWLQRRLTSALAATALVGLHGWADPHSTVTREEALAFELRIGLAKVRPHESNPRERIPLLADDAEINPAYKPVIYFGLMQNMIAVDRHNKLHPKYRQGRGDTFLTGLQILRSAGVRP
jgi:hypothetical protein